jgi:hypothetical protein
MNETRTETGWMLKGLLALFSCDKTLCDSAGESVMEVQIIEDLTLLLLRLTSWEEQVHGSLTIHRAWKGFRFEVLDALEEAGYLNQTTVQSR